MSSRDPRSVTAALSQAEDAFAEIGMGLPAYEPGITSEEAWKTQLTKACRLLEVSAYLQAEGGYYTAVIELCFGAIERTLEAYCLTMGGDELQAFQNHNDSYHRANQLGLFEQETTAGLLDLYGENRTDSYYGGKRPTQEQADAMEALAIAVHEFTVSQFREGGVCLCDHATR